MTSRRRAAIGCGAASSPFMGTGQPPRVPSCRSRRPGRSARGAAPPARGRCAGAASRRPAPVASCARGEGGLAPSLPPSVPPGAPACLGRAAGSAAPRSRDGRRGAAGARPALAGGAGSSGVGGGRPAEALGEESVAASAPVCYVSSCFAGKGLRTSRPAPRCRGAAARGGCATGVWGEGPCPALAGAQPVRGCWPRGARAGAAAGARRLRSSVASRAARGRPQPALAGLCPVPRRSGRAGGAQASSPVVSRRLGSEEVLRGVVLKEKTSREKVTRRCC